MNIIDSAVPIQIEFAPELAAAVTPDPATQEFDVPPNMNGELIIEVVDEAGVKWRYAFLAAPQLIAHTKADDREKEFAVRARQLYNEIFNSEEVS